MPEEVAAGTGFVETRIEPTEKGDLFLGVPTMDDLYVHRDGFLNATGAGEILEANAKVVASLGDLGYDGQEDSSFAVKLARREGNVYEFDVRQGRILQKRYAFGREMEALVGDPELCFIDGLEGLLRSVGSHSVEGDGWRAQVQCFEDSEEKGVVSSVGVTVFWEVKSFLNESFPGGIGLETRREYAEKIDPEKVFGVWEGRLRAFRWERFRVALQEGSGAAESVFQKDSEGLILEKLVGNMDGVNLESRTNLRRRLTEILLSDRFLPGLIDIAQRLRESGEEGEGFKIEIPGREKPILLEEVVSLSFWEKIVDLAREAVDEGRILLIHNFPNDCLDHNLEAGLGTKGRELPKENDIVRRMVERMDYVTCWVLGWDHPLYRLGTMQAGQDYQVRVSLKEVKDKVVVWPYDVDAPDSFLSVDFPEIRAGGAMNPVDGAAYVMAGYIRKMLCEFVETGSQSGKYTKPLRSQFELSEARTYTEKPLEFSEVQGMEIRTTP